MDPQIQARSEPLRKRIKLSPSLKNINVRSSTTQQEDVQMTSTDFHEAIAPQVNDTIMAGAEKNGCPKNREAECGILQWVNEINPGFKGTLKKRYTDFLVNEITPDGTVVHLQNLYPPKPRHQQVEVAVAPELVVKAEEPVVVATTKVEEPIAPAIVQKADIDTVSEPDETDGGVKLVPQSTEANGKPTAETNTANGDAKAVPEISATDIELLDSCFGADIRETIIRMYQKILAKPDAKPNFFGSIFSRPITDKQFRTKLHSDMRRIFDHKFETASDADGTIKITAAPKQRPNNFRNGGSQSAAPRNQQKGKLGWQELGGEFLHFTLYKENKDTMEILAFVASRLRTKPRAFSFAGTKDRRGVTSQRVSTYRMRAEQLAALNRDLYGGKLGDFKYEKRGLELGDLKGNEFLITLRDCEFPDFEKMNTITEKVRLANEVVGSAMMSIQKHGFINYYGLQRFGTYLVGTDEVGKKILQGDGEGAVKAILSYSDEALKAATDAEFVTSDGKPLNKDDIARAQSLHIFETTGKVHEALNRMPRKFVGETTIMRHLERNNKDFMGALLQINRNLRLMYVHAYQSLVWNMAASERWARFHDQVVEGDLVIIDPKEANNQEVAIKVEEEVDQNGEIIVLPAADDIAISQEDMFERARPLTAEEAASGKYTIFDIVLPTPGYDINYPQNAIGDFYKEFMASERGGGLDPSNMRRPQKDFSLSGSYRKIMGTIGDDVTFEVKTYKEDNEQMVETDMERINKSKPQHNSDGNRPNGNRSGDNRGRQNGQREITPPKTAPSVNAEIAAKAAAWNSKWGNAQEYIAAQDKVLDAEAAAEALKRKEDGSEEKRPTFTETYIEHDENGERTGYKSVTTTTNGVSETKVISQRTDGTSPPPVVAPAMKPDGVISEAAAESLKRPTEVAIEKKRLAPETLNDTAAPQEDGPDLKIAVIVKFQLASSQYATMALRELMKEGGVQAFKPNFSSGR